MSMSILSPRQSEVFNYIKRFYKRNSFSPTLKEISGEFDVSVASAQGFVNTLIDKGYLQKTPNVQRSLIPKGSTAENRTISIPTLGFISAGYGIVVNEDVEPEMTEVPADMVNSATDTYCLKVSGWSMKDDGIADGDTVVIQHQAYADNGDTVVAILKGNFEEKATLKKFYDRGDFIELVPKNPAFEPIKLDRSQIEIRGKFKGLIRKDF